MTRILNNIPDAQYLLIQQQVFCILKTIQNSFKVFELNYGTAISRTIATSKMEKRQAKCTVKNIPTIASWISTVNIDVSYLIN